MSCTLLKEFKSWVESQPEAAAILDRAADSKGNLDRNDRKGKPDRNKEYSYCQLDRHSDQLAAQLMASGISRDSIVAICIERSYEMVLAVLAVLKAGGAYLPLDTAWPAERLRYMLSDSGAAIVLTGPGRPNPFPDQPLTCIQVDVGDLQGRDTREVGRALPIERQSQDLCYVIYTSGSTGQPKGVAMVQGVVDHLLQWQLIDSELGPQDRTLQFAPLGFDVSFQEIFASLCSGGTLVLIAEADRVNSGSLLDVVESQRINRLFLPYVALRTFCETALRHQRFPASLREVVTAGEALQVSPALRQFFQRLPYCRLQNQYGPSETHVVTAHTLCGPADKWPALPPIGEPLPHVKLSVLDESQRAVMAGEEGELYIGGEALALGYLNQPELTRERFIDLDGERFYRSGDRVRQNEAGEYLFLGRKDGQVKVRGYRIELAEIEVVLAEHPAVSQAVVDVRQSASGEPRLVAWYTGEALPVGELRDFLKRSLPEYMLPSHYLVLDEFPRTPSGKVARRALPELTRQRPDMNCDFVAPAGELEKLIARLWEGLLEVSPVGRLDNFFDLGGDSLLAIAFAEEIKTGYQWDLSAVDLFQYSTPSKLAHYLEIHHLEINKREQMDRQSAAAVADLQLEFHVEAAPVGSGRKRRAVAIVGMAARFPGANDIEEYWRNLMEGRESVRFFSREELESESSGSWSDDPQFVAAKGVIERPGRFDAGFFGVSPREAQILDPQQRVFLELAWHALEDSGYCPDKIAGRVGVYAGTGNNSYYPNNVAGHRELINRVGAFAVMAGNEKDYVATRVSHKLNLTGPAVSVHTACSTSLVAIHQAVQALRAGECELALAGGASVSAPQAAGYVYQEGGMLSADGHCRPFDVQAGGTVFSDGAGAVVLKLLDQAVADGDHIYAVIEGSAVNNDGADKASFSAPNPLGQSRVILQAQRDAGIGAKDVGYVEAHGTATPLGDPIEVRALNDAFRANGGHQEQGCRLGSVKSNFGHLTAAAGVAGLIKTALMVERGQIPPTLHFKQGNPAIDWQRAGFRVNPQAENWQSESRRIAAVSSFGVGGSNAHIIVAQALATRPSSSSRPWQLICVSHRSEAGLRRYERLIGDVLSSDSAQPNRLADIAFTLNTGRKRCRETSIVVANSAGLAAASFQQRKLPFYRKLRTGAAAAQAAFLFPGQGAQMVGMAQSLYDSEPVYRASVDRSAVILQSLLKEDIRELLYPDLFGASPDPDKLAQTLYTQVSLFVVEYALADLWQHWGVRPAAMFGHSIGEWVAACIAGCLSLEDALYAVYHRGRLMQSQPAGSMLSVQLPAEELRKQMPANLDLAVINSARACVVAGTHEEVDAFAAECSSRDIPNRRLRTSHAFHSRLMEGALEEFRTCIANIRFEPPRIPFLSCVSGDWIRSEEASSREYWVKQIRATVQCEKALATLTAERGRVGLELGPRNTLSSLLKQNAAAANESTALPTLSNSGEVDADWISLLSALGSLTASGAAFDWNQFYGLEKRTRLSLPGYPFEGEDYWLPVVTQTKTGSSDVTAATSLLEPTMETPQAQGECTGNADAMTEEPKHFLIEKVRDIVEGVSGLPLGDHADSTHFLEMGLDSLLLTQVATALKRELAIPLSFRQLMEELTSVDLVVDHVWENMDAQERARYQQSATYSAADVSEHGGLSNRGVTTTAAEGEPLSSSIAEEIIRQQLALMARQLDMLQGSQAQAGTADPRAKLPAAHAAPRQQSSPASPASDQTAEPNDVPLAAPQVFGAQAKIERQRRGSLPVDLQNNLNTFIARYTEKSASSREFTQRNRRRLADPRAVSGFSPLLKEMVYPIVVKNSDGSRLWDLDGNEYVDLVNGFGTNYLGHGPAVVKQALHRQIESSWEIGPQTPLAAEVAELICQLTGMERAALCNTGSEAVMGAIRLARTVTGRRKVVVFEGAYHGINDEAIVRAGRNGRSLPAAAGIPAEAVANVVVLPYGSDEALNYVREQGEDLAAVLVEPVQSRRPDFQPGRFLTALRAATQESGVALIFDEVITGFRIRPGGAQEYFGIRADLATYGKIIGGGMPIGAIAGSSQYMDALDGGYWSFGDESLPETGVTYFAGTFVRHPLAMAAAKAALSFIQEQGPQLQQRINERAQSLCDDVNQYYRLLGFPFKLKNFGSLFKIWFDESQPLAPIFFYKLRELGVHVWEGRPCFITLGHSDEDIALLETRFKEAADFMLQNRFIVESDAVSHSALIEADYAPADMETGEDVEGSSGCISEDERDKDDGDLPARLEKAARVTDTDEATEPQVKAPKPAIETDQELTPGTESAGPEKLAEVAATPDRFSTTEAQREVWLAAQMGEDANCAFNESMALSLNGELHEEALHKAVQTICQRHDALRARISADGREMIVDGKSCVDLEVLTIASQDAYEDLCREAVSRPFDLASGPLLRVQLLRRGSREHVLVFTAHHIICDGWSLYLILQELGRLYSAELDGEAKPSSLPAPSCFADFKQWEDSPEVREKHAQSLNYWRSRLKSSAPFLELPLDKPRPAIKTYSAQRLDHVIDNELLAKVRAFASSQRATITSVFLASFAAFAHRLTGREDILLGMPFAGQLAKEDVNLVGHCVNLLPMKISVESDESFSNLLARVKEALLEALQHQYLTFGTLLKSLDFQRDPSRPALLSTLFNVDINAEEDWQFNSLDARFSSLPRRFENFDMNFNITVSGHEAWLECTYNTDLWCEETIRDRLKEMETFLAACCSEPEEAIAELAMMPPSEQLLWQQNCVGPRRELSAEHMNSLLDLMAHKTATITCGEQVIDFPDLERRANRLANYLLEAGAQQGQRIGVMLDRSVDMLASLLAIWKVGAAYVPLDPGFPAERLRYMIEAAGLQLVVTESKYTEPQYQNPQHASSDGVKHICLDREADEIARKSADAPALAVEGNDTAYVIFTSGSTGKPKGVQIPHRAVCNFLLSMAERPSMTVNDRVLAITTLSFDIAVLELFLPLLVGASLVIAHREAALDGSRLRVLIENQNINFLQATPSTWRFLLAAGWKGDKHFKALCGGEAFPPDLARELLTSVGEVWNMYGPTEATVWCSCHRLDTGDGEGSTVSVGLPLANTRCYVLDAQGNPLPAGVPGELYIGGDCLALGYLDQPELTSQRFVINSVDGSGSLYRSGDRARWLPGKGIECLGRLDNQVKLRGFRIELGEVESRLAEHPEVLECAACVKSYGDTDQRLVAYARLQEGSELNATGVRQFLRDFLPDYMIPQLFVPVETMPLTPNGKIDRNNLPDPMPGRPATSGKKVENEFEKALAGIWTELLGREQQSADELFFDVGGHSLLALDMIAKVENQFKVRISPLDILLNTLGQLAAKIELEVGKRNAAGDGRGVSEGKVGEEGAGEEATAMASGKGGENEDSGAASGRFRKPSLIGRLLGRQLH